MNLAASPPAIVLPPSLCFHTPLTSSTLPFVLGVVAAKMYKSALQRSFSLSVRSSTNSLSCTPLSYIMEATFSSLISKPRSPFRYSDIVIGVSRKKSGSGRGNGYTAYSPSLGRCYAVTVMIEWYCGMLGTRSTLISDSTYIQLSLLSKR